MRPWYEGNIVHPKTTCDGVIKLPTDGNPMTVATPIPHISHIYYELVSPEAELYAWCLLDI